MFCHGLLWNHKMFEAQINHLKNRYQIIAYDHRGQGQSEVTSGGYDMDQLYRDAVDLITHLKLDKVHFVGLSNGGFCRNSNCGTTARIIQILDPHGTTANPEPNKFKYLILNTVVKTIWSPGCDQTRDADHVWPGFLT